MSAPEAPYEKMLPRQRVALAYLALAVLGGFLAGNVGGAFGLIGGLTCAAFFGLLSWGLAASPPSEKDLENERARLQKKIARLQARKP